MARQSREVYRTEDQQLNMILARIAQRLDTLEGIKPDLDPGLLQLEGDKEIITTKDITIDSLIISEATTNRLVYTDADNKVSSVDDLTAFIAGTVDEITVDDDGDGTVTISLPDSIKLDGATSSRILATDGNKKTVSIADLTAWIAGTSEQVTISNDGDGTLTISLPAPWRTPATGDDYIQIESDGTIEFNGTSTVWNDLQFQVSSGKLGVANNPTWTQLTTNTYDYAFDTNDYIDIASNELFHSWKIGTDGNFHIHTSLTTANASGSSYYAKFTLYVAYVGADSIWTQTSLTAELEIPDGSSVGENFYLDMGNVTFTGTMELGTQVKVRISRIAATGGTEYPSDIFIHQIGCHLEEDTIGSRTEATK